MTARLQALFLPNDEYILVLDNYDLSDLSLGMDLADAKKEHGAKSVLIFAEQVEVKN